MNDIIEELAEKATQKLINLKHETKPSVEDIVQDMHSDFVFDLKNVLRLYDQTKDADYLYNSIEELIKIYQD